MPTVLATRPKLTGLGLSPEHPESAQTSGDYDVAVNLVVRYPHGDLVGNALLSRDRDYRLRYTLDGWILDHRLHRTNSWQLDSVVQEIEESLATECHWLIRRAERQWVIEPVGTFRSDTKPSGTCDP